MRCLLKGILLLVLLAVFLPMLVYALAMLAGLVAGIAAPLGALANGLGMSLTAPLALTYGVGVNLLGIVFLVLIIMGIAWLLKSATGGSASDSAFARQSDDEVRLMQDVHRNLSRMERRIEDLETIIIERERRQQR